tara:strand:+ start:178 stop:507 length:330 start_codon:yes stop_codon:yes gene_type:complete
MTYLSTTQQYYQDNIEKLKVDADRYYQNNKAMILEKKKAKYYEHKLTRDEKPVDRFFCECCNYSVSLAKKERHMECNSHQKANLKRLKKIHLIHTEKCKTTLVNPLVGG